MRKFFFLPLLIPSLCEASYEVNCLPLQDLDAQIQFCGENSTAAEAAEACQSALAKKWAEAGPELKEILSLAEQKKNTKQKIEMKLSVKDLEKTQAKLQHLIDMTEDNMLIVANYPSVMPDRRQEDDFPIPCYEDNFARVEKVVQFLDDKIFELENAEEIADQLREISLGNEINIENNQILGIRNSVLKAQPNAINAKGITLSGSTITETTRKNSSSALRDHSIFSKVSNPAVNGKFSKPTNSQPNANESINESGLIQINDPAWIKTVIDQYDIEHGTSK